MNLSVVIYDKIKNMVKNRYNRKISNNVHKINWNHVYIFFICSFAGQHYVA